MEKTIRIKDKTFAVSIPEADILREVDRVAAELNRDLAGKAPLFLSVLNGSFMFMADLMKRIDIPCEVSFVKLASYQGAKSTGRVKELIGLNENLEGRTVVIVEDIVDSGLTMQKLVEQLATHRPDKIHIAICTSCQTDYIACILRNFRLIKHYIQFCFNIQYYLTVFTKKPAPILSHM